MTSITARIALLWLALLALPVSAEAQAAAAPPSVEEESDSAATARIQGWVLEMQDLDGRLQALQQQALADSALDAQQAELGERIRAAMMEADPTLEGSMARVDELQLEAAAADERADTTRLEQIGAEVRRIESQFFDAQRRALTIPEISAELEAFQARVEARIVELEPRVPEMIARFVELRERLAAALQGGG